MHNTSSVEYCSKIAHYEDNKDFCRAAGPLRECDAAQDQGFEVETKRGRLKNTQRRVRIKREGILAGIGSE